MNHPSQQALELYVMGDADDAAAIEEHLTTCEVCRARVAEEAGFELELRGLAEQIVYCVACDQVLRDVAPAPGGATTPQGDGRCDDCGAAARAGGFAIEQVLVQHARGRLYVARDADGKRVALKELAFVQAPGVEAIASFEREAKFLRALEHPGIPRFVASFQEGEGVHTRLYLAQQYIDGPSLESRLRDHWFDEAECKGILRQVLDILVYLQGLSPAVIHRDIKPANLLQRDDGSIALVDFGAAYDQGATLGSTMAGTFGYMPLEQMAGQVDATTDLYALGASILHLLTRREPWKLLEASEPAAVNISEPLRLYLDRLTSRDRAERFADATEAREALNALDHDGPSASMSAPVEPRPRFRILRRVGKFAAVAACVALLAGGGVAAIESLHDDDHHSGERAMLCEAYAERYITLVDKAEAKTRGVELSSAEESPRQRWRWEMRNECVAKGGLTPAELACAFEAETLNQLASCRQPRRVEIVGPMDAPEQVHFIGPPAVPERFEFVVPDQSPPVTVVRPSGKPPITITETEDGELIIVEEGGTTTVVEGDGTVTTIDQDGETTVVKELVDEATRTRVRESLREHLGDKVTTPFEDQ